MKRKSLLNIVPIILVMLCYLVLVGCCAFSDPKPSDPNQHNEYFVKISTEDGGDIVYDTRTRVQYWRSSGYYNRGTLTMLCDKHGTPLYYYGED